jgi:hypothetical protein
MYAHFPNAISDRRNIPEISLSDALYAHVYSGFGVDVSEVLNPVIEYFSLSNTYAIHIVASMLHHVNVLLFY